MPGAKRPNGWRVPETRAVRDTQAIGRGPTRGLGKGGGSFPNTPQQRHAAALTCAEHATSRGDLAELLTIIGLTP